MHRHPAYCTPHTIAGSLAMDARIVVFVLTAPLALLAPRRQGALKVVALGLGATRIIWVTISARIIKDAKWEQSGNCLNCRGDTRPVKELPDSTISVILLSDPKLGGMVPFK
jgi:hypothetical protein